MIALQLINKGRKKGRSRNEMKREKILADKEINFREWISRMYMDMVESEQIRSNNVKLGIDERKWVNLFTKNKDKIYSIVLQIYYHYYYYLFIEKAKVFTDIYKKAKVLFTYLHQYYTVTAVHSLCLPLLDLC